MAEIVTAFPDMQIAMADAGRLHPDQHLRSRWLRRRLLHLSQGRIEIGHLETLHRFTPGIFALQRTLPRPYRRDKRAERMPSMLFRQQRPARESRYLLLGVAALPEQRVGVFTQV